MNVQTSTLADIEEIFKLYRIASDFQRSKKTVTVWPEFDRAMIEEELRDHRQFHIRIDGQVACVWALTYSDEAIWENSQGDAAIYIHRIATNPAFRGNNFVKKIVDWSKEYARAHDKDYVRLDTTGDNTGLINHYKCAGFEFLGMFELSAENKSRLPQHYSQADVCLFEIKL